MMKNKILVQLSKFGAVGIIATATHVLTFTILRSVFLLEEQFSNFIAFLGAFLISWCGHYFWTFQSRNKSSFFRFLIVASNGYVINSFWVWLFITNFSLADYYAMAFMIGVTPFITFTLSRLWAFRER